jgi:hypothetical protein
MKRLAPMNILLVGNNPVELSNVYNSISSLGKGLLNTTVLFDLKKIKQSIKQLSPSAIFIDDRYGMKELRRTISSIHGNSDTNHISITLLKSSNYSNYPKLEADDFILKSGMDGHSIHTSVKNAMRFRKSRIYINKAYRKRKGQLIEMKEKIEDFLQY